jgi:hypothetical protein
MKAALLILTLVVTTIVTSVAGNEPVITESWIGKTAFYNQLGDNEPELDPTHPYSLTSGCAIEGGKIIKATLTTPFNIANDYILYNSNQGNIVKSHKTITALNANFPAGSYRLDISTSTGNASQTITNEVAQFPMKPRIIAGNNTVWIKENLYVINNDLPCSFSWRLPESIFDEVFISINGATSIRTLANSTSTFEIEKSILESLPTNEPVGFLVQFNSVLGNSATTFNLFKVDLTYNGLFKIVKNHAFIQTSNSVPSDWGTKNSTDFFSDYGPYSFSMEATRSGPVIDPKGNNLSLAFQYPNQSCYNSGPISSKDELNRLFSEGTYILGNQTATLVGSTYPNNEIPVKILSVNGKTPKWRDGKLVLNTKVKNIIKWTPFAITANNFLKKGMIEFEIKYINPYLQVFLRKESGILSDSKATFNSYTINANTMGLDRDYLMSIKYFLASSVNAETQSGGGYSTCTYIWITPSGH